MNLRCASRLKNAQQTPQYQNVMEAASYTMPIDDETKGLMMFTVGSDCLRLMCNLLTVRERAVLLAPTCKAWALLLQDPAAWSVVDLLRPVNALPSQVRKARVIRCSSQNPPWALPSMPR